MTLQTSAAHWICLPLNWVLQLLCYVSSSIWNNSAGRCLSCRGGSLWWQKLGGPKLESSQVPLISYFCSCVCVCTHTQSHCTWSQPFCFATVSTGVHSVTLALWGSGNCLHKEGWSRLFKQTLVPIMWVIQMCTNTLLQQYSECRITVLHLCTSWD